MGKNRQLFKKRLFHKSYTYKYILKLLQNAQEKMLDKMYTSKIGWMPKWNSPTLQ